MERKISNSFDILGEYFDEQIFGTLCVCFSYSLRVTVIVRFLTSDIPTKLLEANPTTNSQKHRPKIKQTGRLNKTDDISTPFIRPTACCVPSHALLSAVENVLVCLFLLPGS